MNPAPSLASGAARATDSSKRARQFTQGLSDGLGERLLLFDDTTATSVEHLRFKMELGDAAGFEAALKARVEAVTRLRNPSLGTIRGVERTSEGLSLVSNHIAGRRLSELLQDAHGPAFAIELVRQIGPALVVLQQCGAGIAHAALTPERIVVTREGRLIVVEHVLGSAIETLALSAPQMRSIVGVAVPDDTRASAAGPRGDVIQLGLITLSLLLGRRIDPADYPSKMTALVDEFAKSDADTAKRFRPWLERALQITNGFATATEATEAFNGVADVVAPAAVTTAAPAVAKAADKTAKESKKDVAADKKPAAKAKPTSDAGADQVPTVAASGPSRRTFQIMRIAVAALAVAVIVEGLFIGGLVASRPAVLPSVTIDPRPARAELAPSFVPQMPALTEPRPTATSPTGEGAAPVRPAPEASVEAAPPVGSRFGGVKISCPIELQVREGDTPVGSTAGPIALSDGPHALDLVNDALGFRLRQNVTVKAGQMTPLTIGVPNGRISINAVPWATVLIDGVAAGDTPLANISIPIGPHDILFRHPQLGEQRQSVIVKVEGLTRVSAVLQKAPQ